MTAASDPSGPAASPAPGNGPGPDPRAEAERGEAEREEAERGEAERGEAERGEAEDFLFLDLAATAAAELAPDIAALTDARLIAAMALWENDPDHAPLELPATGEQPFDEGEAIPDKEDRPLF